MKRKGQAAYTKTVAVPKAQRKGKFLAALQLGGLTESTATHMYNCLMEKSQYQDLVKLEALPPSDLYAGMKEWWARYQKPVSPAPAPAQEEQDQWQL